MDSANHANINDRETPSDEVAAPPCALCGSFAHTSSGHLDSPTPTGHDDSPKPTDHGEPVPPTGSADSWKAEHEPEISTSDSVSPSRRETDQAVVVARVLARRQAVLNGRTPVGPISGADVTPGGGDSMHSLRRSLPVTIYLEDDGNRASTRSALLGVLDTFDIEVTDSWPEIRGSWFRSHLARTRVRMSRPEFQAKLAMVERALVLQGVHKPQAEVDAAQGGVVAALITSLNSTTNAIIQIGSVLLIKVEGQLVVRNLTQVELLHLERNPALLREPAMALHELQSVNEPATGLVGPNDHAALPQTSAHHT